MTVIAWDGKLIAADRMATSFGMKSTVTKIRRLASGEVLAWSGNQDCGLLLAEWYELGADPLKWPEFQKSNDDWSRLIVADSGGVMVYEQRCTPLVFADKSMAFGSGRDYAMGAMAMGANAIRAVEVACQFDMGCGNGVEWFDLSELRAVA